MRQQATQPIAIVASGSSATRQYSHESVNCTDDSDTDDDHDLQSKNLRPNHQPCIGLASAVDNFQLHSLTGNFQDLVTVGSLPSSRRERRFMVSTGGHELGGYGMASRSIHHHRPLASHTSNHSTSHFARSLPIPPAPFLGSRKDKDKGEKLTRMPKMTLPESIASSLDSSSSMMSYGSLRESSFHAYHDRIGKVAPTINLTTDADSTFVSKRLSTIHSAANLCDDNDGIRSRKSSTSALASLLGDCDDSIAAANNVQPHLSTIYPSTNTSINTDSISSAILVNDPHAQDENSRTYHSNYYSSDNSSETNHFLNMKSNLPDFDRKQLGTSLTGLNILESTWTRSENVGTNSIVRGIVVNIERDASTHTRSIGFSNLHMSSTIDSSELEQGRKLTVALNNFDFEDNQDPDRHGAFDLDMDD